MKPTSLPAIKAAGGGEEQGPTRTPPSTPRHELGEAH